MKIPLLLSFLIFPSLLFAQQDTNWILRANTIDKYSAPILQMNSLK